MTRLSRLLQALGAAELARRVGRSPATVRRWARAGAPASARDDLRVVERRRDAARKAAAVRAERAEKAKRARQRAAARAKAAQRRAAAERAAKAKARAAAAKAKSAKEARAKERERQAAAEARAAAAKRKRRQRAAAERAAAERAAAERTAAERAAAERAAAERAAAERAAAERAAAERVAAERAAPAPSDPRVLTTEQVAALRALGLLDAFPWRAETSGERAARLANFDATRPAVEAEEDIERLAIQAEAKEAEKAKEELEELKEDTYPLPTRDLAFFREHERTDADGVTHIRFDAATGRILGKNDLGQTVAAYLFSDESGQPKSGSDSLRWALATNLDEYVSHVNRQIRERYGYATLRGSFGRFSIPDVRKPKSRRRQ
jgi:hypothetical protein